MGRRGPKPTPTPLLKLRGSWRAETREGEPRATPELPDCPDWLPDGAKAHWPEVGAMLAGLGVMAKPHTVGLALLCDALADWIRFSELAATNPLAVGDKAKAWERVLKACREFGMTPAAITAVRTVPKAPEQQQSPRMKFKLA